MWFGVLGPLSILDGDTTITVEPAKQRVLLAALLFHANQIMSFDEIAHVVWDGAPAQGARTTVRNYVLRLRRVLGPAVGGRIVTRDPGYAIELGEDELDVLRFSRLCRDGGAAVRAGNWQLGWDVLEEALGLWRGAPLQDVHCMLLRRDEIPPLTEARLQALDWRFEAALQLGRHAEVVSEVESAAAEHPLRERFHSQLMLALYRNGRRADALAAYGRARGILVEELGLEPGPELRRLHDRMLRSDPGLSAPARLAGGGETARPGRDTVIPRQLPAGTAHFAGRSTELKRLTHLLDQFEAGAEARVIALIGGTPGIGKTALAVHWSHACALRFPDGQLYVNLRGFDPSGPPLTWAEAVHGFLDALAVPPVKIPASPDQQVTLYRDLLAGKRTLIVLDNARDEEQVRPLIPDAPSCAVVVTSRNSMTGLVASYRAVRLMLDVLPAGEARDLLTRRIGAKHVEAEPATTSLVIEHCAGLPLALAIASARAATNPHLSLADLAAELRDSRVRLDALGLADPTMNVRSVFTWSYRALSQDAARLFRLIGVSPGPDTSVNAAASLMHLSPGRTRSLLHELTRTCLLTEPVPDRFACHDLLRAYAAELAANEHSENDRRAAIHRLLDHYTLSSNNAAISVNQQHDQIPLDQPQPGALAESFAAADQAMAWFDAERAVLLGAITMAADHGFDGHAWKLGWALARYFSQRGRWSQCVAALHTALASAQASGDPTGQALTWCYLGRAAASLGDHEGARRYLLRAVSLFADLGDHCRHAAAHNDLVRVCVLQGDFAAALVHAQSFLELARVHSEPGDVAAALNAVGWSLAQLGEHEDALVNCEEAVAIHREIGDEFGEAMTLDSIGYIHFSLGNYADSVLHYTQALGGLVRNGYRWPAADTLDRIGDAHLAAGSPAEAMDAWRQAIAIMEELQHPAIDEVRAKLTPDSTLGGRI